MGSGGLMGWVVQVGAGGQGCDLALAGGFGDLVGGAGAVPCGEHAGEIGGHAAVDLDGPVGGGQGRQQVRGGHGGAEDKDPRAGDALAVGGQAGDGQLALDRDGAGLDKGDICFQRFRALGGKVGHLTAQVFQEVGLLRRIGTAADHGHGLAPVEHPVAGGAVAHTPAQILSFPRKFFLPHHAGGQDQGPGGEDLAAHADLKAVPRQGREGAAL